MCIEHFLRDDQRLGLELRLGDEPMANPAPGPAFRSQLGVPVQAALPGAQQPAVDTGRSAEALHAVPAGAVRVRVR